MNLFETLASWCASLTTTVAPDAATIAIPLWMDLLGASTGSIGGALIARKYKLDFFGCVAMGLITGLGGGLLRDVILQVGNVYILNQPLAIPVCLAAATAALLFPRVVEHQDRLVSALDIFTVGLFAAVGADKALVFGFEPAVCVIMGFLTAVGGGMLRDICINRTPGIFVKSNFYAIAALLGCSVYLTCSQVLHVQKFAAAFLCVAVTMGTRYLSLRLNIQSPENVDLTPVVVRPVRKVRNMLRATSANRGAVNAEVGAHRRKRNAQQQARAYIRRHRGGRKEA